MSHSPTTFQITEELPYTSDESNTDSWESDDGDSIQTWSVILLLIPLVCKALGRLSKKMRALY